MKPHRWKGLRTKILAWSFVPTVIILTAVAWFTFYSYQKVLGDLAIKQDWAVVHAKADQADEALSALANSRLRPIVLEIDTDPSIPLELRAEIILERMPGIETFDGGIYFVDRDGMVFKTHPERPELMGQDWSDTPQFRFSRDQPSGSAPITDVRSMGEGGQGIVCAMWPMRGSQGEFAGAAYYCFSIEPTGETVLFRLFNGLSLGRDVIVVDGNLRIVFSPDPGQAGRDLSGEAALQQLLQGQSQSIRFRRGTEDTLISYDPFATVVDARNRWVVVSEQSWPEVMRPTLPFRRFLLVLLALGVVVPTLVTGYGVRHITGPIQKLIQAAEKVTAGDFGHRIEVKTGDEIEALADQFNLMSAELDESYSSLERKVEDRTREMAILNSIISVASHSLNIQEILEDALNKTVEQMGFDAGAAFRVDTDPMSTVLTTQRGFESANAADLAACCAMARQRIPAGHAEEVSALALEDLLDEGLRNQFSQFDCKLLVCIPLTTKGRELGFFILGKHAPGQLPPEEVSLLSSIGQQVGVAMENAHLFEQAEQTATATERNRLARELHDAVTQTLFSANLIADVIPRIWKRNPEDGLHSLEELRQLTRGALAEMRTLLLEMRPDSLERAEIKPLLTQLADAFVGRVRVPVSVALEGDCELTHEVKLAIYRVAQEALHNIAKHSGARHVELRLDCRPGQAILRIRDDGLGFDPGSIPPDHLGIAIMRERAGSIGGHLEIASQPGQGTTVELDWRAARKD
ncbi:MAG TPA: histidine kinase [Nitrospiraceae bacterium]|nr:histidine kinase [Nitrospiraceae bacterium]